MNERDYIRGRAAAHTAQLEHLLGELATFPRELTPEQRRTFERARYVAERRRLVAQLRTLCEHFGDNEWDDDDNLECVLEKHLGKYLHELERKARELVGHGG